MKATPAKLLLLLIACATIVSGCASTPKNAVFPIEGKDIEKMKKGQSFTPNRDGYFVSDFYFKELMQAKVDEINRSN